MLFIDSIRFNNMTTHPGKNIISNRHNQDIKNIVHKLVALVYGMSSPFALRQNFTSILVKRISSIYRYSMWHHIQVIYPLIGSFSTSQVDFCCCHTAPLTIAESQPIEPFGAATWGGSMGPWWCLMMKVNNIYRPLLRNNGATLCNTHF